MPGDLAGSDRYFDLDLVDPPIRARSDGTLGIPSGPGIGATVVPDVLRHVTSHEEVIEAGVG
jgi:O-succinylbenzoate synthase